MIKVLAIAGYQFNDFLEQWVPQEMIEFLQQEGTRLKIVSPVKAEIEESDILILDMYFGRIRKEKLTALKEKAGKVVIIHPEKPDKEWLTGIDYFCINCCMKLQTVYMLVKILLALEMITERKAEEIIEGEKQIY